jgi:hypothetical protein
MGTTIRVFEEEVEEEDDEAEWEVEEVDETRFKEPIPIKKKKTILEKNEK